MVGVPVGNLADITYRVVDVLKCIGMITCEDTRVTSKLCSHYDIPTPLKSHHEYNEDRQTALIIEQLELSLDVVPVSGAGLPLTSDPGYELVVAAREANIRVETVPGPNARLTALMVSGLPSYVYTFLGFLPRKEKEENAVLERRMHEDSTLIIYESSHRVIDILKTITKIDATRQISPGCESTKKFEQAVIDDVIQLQALIQQDDVPLKGEFIILIEGAKANNEMSWFDDLFINEHVDHYIQTSQMKPKQAIKKVAKERQLKMNGVYNTYHQIS